MNNFLTKVTIRKGIVRWFLRTPGVSEPPCLAIVAIYLNIGNSGYCNINMGVVAVCMI